MAEEGAVPSGPPAGVPDAPGQSGAVPGGLIFQTPQALQGGQVFGNDDVPAPASPANAPVAMPGAQVFAPQAPASNQPISGSKLFTRMPSGSDVLQSGGMSAEAAEKTIEIGKRGASMVGKALAPLTYPIRGATAAVIGAADLLGVPGAAEMKQKLNPTGRLFPDAYISDVTDFYLDKAAQAAGVSQMGDQARLMYGGVKFGIGMGANILGDPFRLLEVGTYTKAAEDLQKAGKVMEAGADERNLLSVRAPFSEAKASIPLAPVQDVLSPVASAFKRVPGVETVANAIQRLSPDTGYADVDLASSSHAALGRGEVADVKTRYLMPNADRGFTDAEKAAISKLVEATPNMAPDLPPALIKAAQGKLSGNEAGVRAQMLGLLEKESGIAPGRAETIVDGAIDVKKMGAEYIQNLHKAGLLDRGNIAEKVIENHLPHVMDPNYRDVHTPAQLAAKQAAEATSADRLVKGSYLSSTDPTRYRSLRGTLDEANAYMKEKTGLSDFFITDPHVASGVRLLESQKLVRDKNLLETIEKYGQRMKPSEARAAGMVPINHPDFNGKTVIIKNEHGPVIQTRFQDMVFPKDIAEKMSYYIKPPAVTNIQAQLGSLNRIFRSTSFLSPGFWIRNAADNTVKNIVQGVTNETHLDTLKLFLDKLPGIRSEGNALTPAGMAYSGDNLRELLTKWGITSSSAFRDGVGDFMTAGKRLTLSQALSDPRQLSLKYSAQAAESMLKGVSHFGEKGENFTRAALFMQRLKDGYTPEMAAREVTKYLFDYTRNSKATDSLRFFFPFIQHPIKTALVAPELLGGGLGTYNAVHNTLPHVLAAAFHDPIAQTELNTLLPDNLKARDVIAGPLLTGNTQLVDLLRNPKTPGNIGSLIYFDPSVGMRILNHFNYFSKEAQVSNYGLSPLFGSLLRAGTGSDNFGNSLDQMTPGTPDWANRASYVFWNGILGTVNFHNAEKMAAQAFGIGDPKFFEPNTVLLMKGALGQFGGVTNLDRDYFFKMIALGHQRADLVSQMRKSVMNESRNMSSASSLAQWVSKEYGQIVPTTNQKILQNVQAKLAEMQGQELSASAAQGHITAADYAGRIKNIDDTLGHINRAYQFGVGRYLQLGSGAKSPTEARAKAGVGR